MAKSATPAAKQKNLFSFFSKKAPSPKTASAASKTSGSPASSTSSLSSSSSSSNNGKKTAASSSTNAKPSSTARKGEAKMTSAQSKLLSKITIGTKLAVFWPDDSEFYPCIVHAHRPNAGSDKGHVCVIHYDDGEIETVDLSTERFRIIGGKKRQSSGDDDDGDCGGGKKSGGNATASSGDGKKKRRILEDTDEDEEMGVEDESGEDSGDESGSEYKAAGGDDSMDDESLDAEEEEKVNEDDLLDSDGEEEETPKKRKAIKKKVTITQVGGDATSKARKITPTPMPSMSTANKKSPVDSTMNISNFAAKSPVNGSATSSQKPPSSSSSKFSAKKSSPALSPMQNQNLNTKMAAAATPPKPIPGISNQAGSHMHNHLKFFTTHRKDMNGHSPAHPDYTHRTLKVDYTELARQQDNGKISPAQKQWWDIKAQYADTVLLFKTGKFYEMFHDDADVGNVVLGNVYMKGTSAHSGFPEAGYAKFLDKLVVAGYKVARVEQTETKDAFEKRKKGVPRGQKKPQVMCREVCSIVSKGTRTFCYLDNTDLLERGERCTGPLVAIKEVLIEGECGVEEDDSEAGTKAVYEYGVTIVDAVTGVVTLGQFADDMLRSRMQTLLASFGPSEVLYEGSGGSSKTLQGFLKTACPPNTILDIVNTSERFPKSSAVKADDRRMIDRLNTDVHPWDDQEALKELHRRGYYPRSSRKNNHAIPTEGISRWPEILRHCIEGGATLALSSFGAALFYLQRSLVDTEILSMGIVKAYAPPNTSMDVSDVASVGEASRDPSVQLQDMYEKEARRTEGVDLVEQQEPHKSSINFATSAADDAAANAAEANTGHMALDGTTLSNLEILNNLTSGSYQGSLLSKIDATRSPHGSKLLRAWLLRPLFRKEDIDRRADAVEELAGGSVAMAMAEARDLIKKTGDLERLLSRVHSMGSGVARSSEDGASAASAGYHPNERAVLYETDKYTKRKVGDFSKVLNGLRAAAEIPDLFENVDIQSGMLAKIVRTIDEGGVFPTGMKEKLDWFFDNFDLKKAAKGEFEPSRGISEEYDEACDAIEHVKRQLDEYKEEMCSSELQPRNTARSSWKYVNIKSDSKDKYLIELPGSVEVPDDFFVKAKRGKGAKLVNKYRTPVVEELVQELERAIAVKNEGKAAGMALIFARFDSMRSMWTGAQQATAMLDALGSLAQLAVQPGFSRPRILGCPPGARPGLEVIQGRHPCVEKTHSGDDFIPNDLVLGSKFDMEDDGFAEDNDAHSNESSLLLLSGPNMGGKSTLLRQTCLIAILAQVGSFVPAESCALTPVDRIFTRLGASDRILCGQSTFFVELAETAAAVRGATRRSLVIMDELGRGTSTFDGTAIASATVKHLVERNRCLTLFATHYHSLLEDWKNEPSIKLGHMECVVEEDEDDGGDSSGKKNNITFLYSLGAGAAPKSFGVNVARLAGLPDDVLQRAKRVSSQFEAELNGEITNQKGHKIIPAKAEASVDGVSKLFSGNRRVNASGLKRAWESLQ